MLVLGCVAPVLGLGGLYLLATRILLVPAVPDERAPPDQVVQFVIHDKGLPRLNGGRSEAFLQQQIRRLAQDPAFRKRFLAEYRTSSPEEQKAFRAHLFDALKPLVMRDVRNYHELAEPARPAYVDERIVAYNRMSAFVSDVRVSKNDPGPVLPGPDEALHLLMQRTTEEERQMGLAYAAALQARVLEILADPALRAEFEARIAAPGR